MAQIKYTVRINGFCLMNRAIIHDFHSQVPFTVRDLDEQPDLIISLDSHFDCHLVLEDQIDEFPDGVDAAATRASAHGLLRSCTGGLKLFDESRTAKTEIIIVNPEGVLNKQALDMDSLMVEAGYSELSKIEAVMWFIDRMSSMLGVEIYLCPPHDLMKLLDRTSRASTWLLDIDIDYMHEMQGECYTPISNAVSGDLGWVERVLRFIRKSKPDIITISEAKVSAIQNPKSAFSKFILRLQSLGYQIEQECLFNSDEEALNAISLYDEYYNTVLRKLAVNFASESSEGLDQERLDEMKKATRDFFKTKGFS